MATGTLSPNPWLTFLDTNGNPLAGGFVTTYMAGTTTLQATYADVALTIANQNPLTLDAAGRAVIYLSPGSSYKFAVTTSAGATVRTQDNVSAVPTSAATLDVTGTVGEAVSAGQPVYLSDGSGGKTAGLWYRTDSANAYSSTSPTVGLAPASLASLSSGTIRLSGTVSGLSSVTVGTTYYVGTLGTLTATAPSHARLLGVADTTSSLILAANPPPASLPFDNGLVAGRLTLTTAVPITTTDVTAATTLYFTPYQGNRIALYDGTNWHVRIFTELSIAVPATTSQMYDVWVYDNSGTAALEVLGWTNDTTRATALVTQDGVLSKTGALTRRYVGSFRTTGVSGQTESSVTKRYMWNYYNRVKRPLRVKEATNTWSHDTTWHQVNAAAGNQVDVVVGFAEAELQLTATGQIATTTSGGMGIGEDSTTALAAECINTQVVFSASSSNYPLVASLQKMPAVGRHYYAWIEWAAGASTFYGDNGAANVNTGLSGWIDG